LKERTRDSRNTRDSFWSIGLPSSPSSSLLRLQGHLTFFTLKKLVRPFSHANR